MKKRMNIPLDEIPIIPVFVDDVVDGQGNNGGPVGLPKLTHVITQSKCDYFDGDDCLTWFKIFDSYANAHGWSDEAKLAHFPGLLKRRSKAFNWYYGLDAIPDNFHDLRRIALQDLGSHDEPLSAWERCKNRKQQLNENVMNYYFAKRRLVEEASPASEEGIKVQQIIEDLLPEIKFKVYGKVSTLDKLKKWLQRHDTIEAARVRDQPVYMHGQVEPEASVLQINVPGSNPMMNNQQRNQWTPRYPNNNQFNGGNNQRFQRNGFRTGYTPRSNFYNQRPQDTRRFQYGQRPPFAPRQFTSNQQRPRRSSEEQAQFLKDMEEGNCFSCHKTGHSSRECPERGSRLNNQANQASQAPLN